MGSMHASCRCTRATASARVLADSSALGLIQAALSDPGACLAACDNFSGCDGVLYWKVVEGGTTTYECKALQDTDNNIEVHKIRG